jgi:uncharacterized membrane protein
MEISRIIYEKTKFIPIRICQFYGITANQLTYFNHFITITLGCFAFSRGSYLWGLTGLMVMLVNGYLDYLDGDIARLTAGNSKFGEWIDSSFDVVIQNIVMGAISLGCYRIGMPLLWIVLFFISNSGNNLVAFHYNQTFGFSSSSGNALFRECMDKRPSVINIFFKNIIDPTSSTLGLGLLTFRYWIIVGIVFNIMPICFMTLTIINNIKWAVMFILYGMHLSQNKSLYVLMALAILDEGRNEFYKVRYK